MKCNYSKKFVRKRIKLFADDDESTSNKIVDNLMPVAGLAALGGIGYAGYKGITGIGKGLKNGANFASGFWTNKKTGMNTADAYRNAKTTGQDGLIQNFLDRREINKQQKAAANANNNANQTGGIGETVKKAVTTPTEGMQQEINAAEERAKQQLSGNNTTTGGTGGNTGGQKTGVNSEAEEILNKAKENNTTTGGTGGNTGQQTATEMAEKSKQHSQFKPKVKWTAEQIEAAKAAGAGKRLAREVARENNVDTLEERKKRLDSAKQILVENPDVGANRNTNKFLVSQAKDTFDPKRIRRVHNKYVQQEQHEAAVARKQQVQQQRADNRQNAYIQNVKLKNLEENKQLRAQRKVAAKENIDPLAAKAKLVQENPEKFNRARQTAAKKNTKLIKTKDLSTLSVDQANSVTRFRDARQRAEQNQKQRQQLAARQEAQQKVQQEAQQKKQQRAADRQNSRNNRRQETEQQGQQITQFRQKRNEYLNNPVVQQSPEAMRDVYQGKFRKAKGIVANQQYIDDRRQRSQNYIHVYSPEQLEVRAGRTGKRNFDSLAPENKAPAIMTQSDREKLENARIKGARSTFNMNYSSINSRFDNAAYRANEIIHPRRKVTEPFYVPFSTREKRNILRTANGGSNPVGPVVQSNVKFQPGGLKMANATGSNNTNVNSATQQNSPVQQNSNKVAKEPVTSSNAQVNAPQTQAKPQQTATEMAEKSKQHSQFKPKNTQTVTRGGIRVPKKPVVMLAR